MRVSPVIGKVRVLIHSLLFVVTGIVMIVICVLAIRAPKKEYLPTTATIVEIQEDYDVMEEEYVYQVFVNYQANGVRYQHIELGSYDSSMQVGNSVDIEYAVDEPKNIQTPGSEKIVYIVLGAGILAVLSGAVMTVKGFIA